MAIRGGGGHNIKKACMSYQIDISYILLKPPILSLPNFLFHCVNTSYLPDDSYSPARAGPAKRKKKTSRVSPPAGPAHYNPLARWPSSCLTRQRDVTS